MKIKVALVHDWLVTWRGGEKVLLELARLFPEAPIYTLFLDRQSLPDELRARKIIVNPITNLFRRFRKAMLPILPLLIQQLDLDDYDLVLSTSSCVAKGAPKRPDSKHLCYIHSPMRYAWDQKREYFGRLLDTFFIGWLLEFLLKRLRNWDVESAKRVDLFVANSTFVKDRVQNYYGLQAAVVYPPIDLAAFPACADKQGYLLAAGAFVSYKRFDLAILAAEKLKKRIIVAGSGPEEARLRSMAGPYTEFQIAPDQEQWIALLQGADALLFPGIEDFGMIAIEAMSCGTPVIAAQAGGALDFIIEQQTGFFFEPGNVESLMTAIRNLTHYPISAEYLATFSRAFSREAFKANMARHLNHLMGGSIVESRSQDDFINS